MIVFELVFSNVQSMSKDFLFQSIEQKTSYSTSHFFFSSIIQQKTTKLTGFIISNDLVEQETIRERDMQQIIFDIRTKSKRLDSEIIFLALFFHFRKEKQRENKTNGDNETSKQVFTFVIVSDLF